MKDLLFILKFLSIPIVCGFVVALIAIVIPEVIYKVTENTKLEKLVEHDLFKMLSICLLLFAGALVIVKYIYILGG